MAGGLSSRITTGPALKYHFCMNMKSYCSLSSVFSMLLRLESISFIIELS